MDKDYKVVFTDGSLVEFTRKGNWKDVKCMGHAVPSAIVPNAISQYVKNNYPNVYIVEIEHDGKKFSVELSNDVELKFDRKHQIREVDY